MRRCSTRHSCRSTTRCRCIARARRDGAVRVVSAATATCTGRHPAPHARAVGNAALERRRARRCASVLEHFELRGRAGHRILRRERGKLVANEMAPRVHNSGHWTIEGAVTSQFENHLRAICGPAAGQQPARRGHCAMINLIGEHARPATRCCASAGLHWHDYGKDGPAGPQAGPSHHLVETPTPRPGSARA